MRLGKEEEASRLAREEEKSRLAKEEDASRLAREEEKSRLAKQEEEEKVRLGKEEEVSRLAREEEASRLAGEEETSRVAREEEEKGKSCLEQEQPVAGGQPVVGQQQVLAPPMVGGPFQEDGALGALQSADPTIVCMCPEVVAGETAILCMCSEGVAAQVAAIGGDGGACGASAAPQLAQPPVLCLCPEHGAEAGGSSEIADLSAPRDWQKERGEMEARQRSLEAELVVMRERLAQSVEAYETGQKQRMVSAGGGGEDRSENVQPPNTAQGHSEMPSVVQGAIGDDPGNALEIEEIEAKVKVFANNLVTELQGKLRDTQERRRKSEMAKLDLYNAKLLKERKEKLIVRPLSLRTKS